MRQAGIVAAAGVYALDNCVERLADDHSNVKKIAHGTLYRIIFILIIF
jgi:threonine aldolase